MTNRPSWHQYFMTITRQVAERSTCNRAKVGAVIARDRNIVATGYNGSPAGLPHCTEVSCLIYRRTRRARWRELLPHHPCEINAISTQAKSSASIRDRRLHHARPHYVSGALNTASAASATRTKRHTLEEMLSTPRHAERVDL
jgi:deoxycytidylate deaminase